MRKEKTFLGSFIKNKAGMFGFIIVLIIIILGVFAPQIVEYPTGYGSAILTAPSSQFPFGTDSLGLNVFGEVVWGARTSLLVSVIAVAVASLIGIPLGLISGYMKGALGSLIDSVIDIFLTLPMLPLMIVIAAILGSSISRVAVVIGIFAWPSLARVTRNATLRISEMQYIEAAKCLGIPSYVVLFKHILLNVIGPILVNITLIMATAVISESGLSFLGLGDPSVWSWGTILKKAWDSSAVIKIPNPYWWWLAPSAFITIYVVAFNLLGTAINETLNPKTRE